MSYEEIEELVEFVTECEMEFLAEVGTEVLAEIKKEVCHA